MSSISQAQPRGSSKRQLLIAGVLGLAAAILVAVVVGGGGDDSASTVVASVPVVVARQDLVAGQKISNENVELKSLPQNALTPGAIATLDKALGLTVRYPVARGEQLTDARVVGGARADAASSANARGLSFQIEPGQRAMTIPVSITNTPAALIAPGDFVDVIVSIKATSLVVASRLPQVAGRDAADLTGAATILQNVQVLSVQRTIIEGGVPYDSSVRGALPSDKDNIGFVTLAVKPDQAQLLWLASQEGKLTIILRPFGDQEQIPLAPRIEPLLLP